MSMLCERNGKLVLGVSLGIAGGSSVLYMPWDFPSDAWQATGMQYMARAAHSGGTACSGRDVLPAGEQLCLDGATLMLYRLLP